MGHALIVVEDDNPVGMFTERDVLKCWTRKGEKPFKDIKVAEVMTVNMIIAEQDDDLCYVTTIMIKNRIRHLPVIERARSLRCSHKRRCQGAGN
jgi:IMP dehydrogenase